VEALILGAGGVGLGFVSELLGRSGWQMTFADIDSELVAALNRYGSISFNKVGAQIEQIKISGLSAIDLGGPSARQELAEALAAADLVFTAAGAGAFSAVGKLLATAAETIGSAHQPLNVLCSENHKDAAAALTEATSQAMSKPELLAERFSFVNTIVARMCQRLTTEERNLPPVAPGLDVVIVAEDYQVFPIDGSAIAGPVPEFEGLRILSRPEFEAWDHRKLYAHNGIHALLGVLGNLAGYTYMYECRMSVVRTRNWMGWGVGLCGRKWAGRWFGRIPRYLPIPTTTHLPKTFTGASPTSYSPTPSTARRATVCV